MDYSMKEGPSLGAVCSVPPRRWVPGDTKHQCSGGPPDVPHLKRDLESGYRAKIHAFLGRHILPKWQIDLGKPS